MTDLKFKRLYYSIKRAMKNEANHVIGHHNQIIMKLESQMSNSISFLI